MCVCVRCKMTTKGSAFGSPRWEERGGGHGVTTMANRGEMVGLTVVVVKLGWWCSGESRSWWVEVVPCQTAMAMKTIGASSSSPAGSVSLLPPPSFVARVWVVWSATSGSGVWEGR